MKQKETVKTGEKKIKSLIEETDKAIESIKKHNPREGDFSSVKSLVEARNTYLNIMFKMKAALLTVKGLEGKEQETYIKHIVIPFIKTLNKEKEFKSEEEAASYYKELLRKENDYNSNKVPKMFN